MSETYQITDFDFSIDEILLIHRNSFVRHFKWNEYRTGRQSDGLVFCMSGQSAFDFGDFSLTLCTGQMLFLPACSAYTVRAVGTEPFIHYTANFRLTPHGVAGESLLGDMLAGRHYPIVSAAARGNAQEKFDQLLFLWQSKRTGYRILSKAILYELLGYYIIDAGRSLRDKDSYEKLLPARRLLDEHYYENQTSAELAALCHLSETHFRRLFAATFGSSPIDYRIRRRILKAQDLLLSGEFNVSQTAEQVGFSDANYFARVFRAHTGLSPSDYRKGL